MPFSPFPAFTKAGLPAGVLLASLLLTGSAVHAQTFYSTRSAFDAAAGPITSTEDFSGIAPTGGFKSYGPTDSTTLGGFTFSETIPTYLAVNSSTYYNKPAYNLGNGDYLIAGYGNPAELTILLPVATTAFGLDLGTFGPAGGQVTALLSNGTSDAVAASFRQVSFFGFTSATPIQSLTLTETDESSTSETLTVDTLEAHSSPVPEASAAVSTGLLLALGLGGLLVSLRKRNAPNR